MSARPHYYLAFGIGVILHLILHFSQKVAIFALKRVISLLFVPTLFFFVSGQYFRYKHRPKSADKPACISLGYHHIAFSKINSKCDRAFVAPPEFKSLMLRQSTVQRAFFEHFVPFFYAKNGIFEFDNFITGEKTPCSGEKSHFFKCHFPDLNPFQARSALLLLKKPWKRSPNANKYSRW